MARSPLPHISVDQMLRSSTTSQTYPVSILQISDQPSSIVILLSSHSSVEAFTPSPHVVVQTLVPVVVHVKPVSTSHVLDHPSPSSVLSSSHSSPFQMVPLPHASEYQELRLFDIFQM
jgi:hypothetical protein